MRQTRRERRGFMKSMANNTYTRRDLFKLTGIAGAALAGGTLLAGCSSSGGSAKDTPFVASVARLEGAALEYGNGARNLPSALPQVRKPWLEASTYTTCALRVASSR